MNNKTAIFPFPNPISIMAKSVGSICNLNCAYCYYLEKEKLYGNRKSLQMSDETLEKYIKSYIESQPIPKVLFTWHGGETLLRDLSFYRKALLLQKRYGRGRQIQNCLQTNGVLLNDDWCKFFKENNFLIGISIDGPEHCHDIYRKNKGGNGTFKQVMRGIELLQKHQVDFNTLSVINNYNVDYPLEVYNFFKEIGSQYMQFSPIVEQFSKARVDGLTLIPPVGADDATLAPWSVNTHRFGQFYISIFDEWIKKDVGRYYIQLFDATLAGTIGQMPGVCIFSETCGHAPVMEFNGDMYACDHFVFPEYKIGNINTHTIYEMGFSQKQLRFGADKRDTLPTQCRKCEFKKLCNGECPKNRIISTSTGEPGLNYLCEGYYAFWKHTKPYMEFMANELNSQRSPANVMHWKI